MVQMNNSEPASSLATRLIAKYNQPVPRYTSYPTALKFCIVDDTASRDALCRETDDHAPLSLYFHLPFCARLCWFCGCTKIISTQSGLADTYLDYLELEVDLVRPGLGADRTVAQLHFGGGTPNFLTPEQIQRLSQIIHARFEFDPDAEISVEIDPRTLTEDKVQAFRALGVNRASMGVQDVNPAVQKAIHRIQPSDMNRRAIDWLRQSGIQNFNIDLIYGLPRQTPESFADTLDEVLSYDPDRFALFSYAHVPWSKPAQKILEQAELPSPEAKIAMHAQSVERLKQAGYAHIGMDHFTKADDSLAVAQRSKTLQRNFQGYSLFKDAEICGFGISAISQSPKSYRQNFKDLETYYAFLDAGKRPVDRGYLLSNDDRIRRQVIMRLMCDMELDFREMGRALDIDFDSYFASERNELNRLSRDGLITLDDNRLVVTDLGRILIRPIAAVFDRYYGKDQAKYSKAL